MLPRQRWFFLVKEKDSLFFFRKRFVVEMVKAGGPQTQIFRSFHGNRLTIHMGFATKSNGQTLLVGAWKNKN